MYFQTENKPFKVDKVRKVYFSQVFFRSFLGVFWSFFPYIFKVYLTLSGDKSVLERFKMHFEKGDLRVFV